MVHADIRQTNRNELISAIPPWPLVFERITQHDSHHRQQCRVNSFSIASQTSPNARKWDNCICNNNDNYNDVIDKDNYSTDDVNDNDEQEQEQDDDDGDDDDDDDDDD